MRRILLISLAALALDATSTYAKTPANGSATAKPAAAARTAAPATAKPAAKTPAQPAAPVMPRFTEGVEYEKLNVSPAPPQAAHIEVTEFFSYGCIHCFHFEPIVEGWRKQKPADVDLVLVPATFRPDFALFARGYYAAQALGVADKTHAAIWDALWKHERSVRTIADLADLYASVGVDRNAFIDACADPAIEAKLKHATEQLMLFTVAGTPDLLVAGKYRVLLSKLPNAAQAFDVVNYLLGLERAERKQATAAARH